MSDKSDVTPAGKPPRASLFRGAPKPAPDPKAAPNPKRTPQPPRKRRRGSGLGLLSAVLTFILVGALVGVAGFAGALLEINRSGPLDQDKIVMLTREDDGGPISEQLERSGVIDSALLFSALTLIDGTRGALKRGEYEFKARSSLRDVEQLLISHKVVQHKFVVPEGLTSEQVVQRLRSDDAFAGDVKETPREGSLLPDTYFFERGEARSAMITRMMKAQAKAVDDIWKRRAPGLPIKSPGELVTLASVIEKETGKPDERPRVAGVFVNRLQKHMKLQSDPTIVYGLVGGKGTLGHPITKAELTQPTSYNTYIIDNLPPGPICNPGRAAMEAAANPAKSADLYFVADGTGGHAFATTLDQHLKNVARWRQIELDAKDKIAPEAGAPGAPSPTTHGAANDDTLIQFGYVAPELVRPDPQMFGAVTPLEPAPGKPTAKSKALMTKLAKLGDTLNKQKALTAAGGPLSAQALLGAKTIDSLGAVVTGVNDGPETVTFGEDPPAAEGVQAAATPVAPMAPSTPLPPGKVAVFDVSEGTALDPLRNKTYDLGFAKDVPDLKTPKN